MSRDRGLIGFFVSPWYWAVLIAINSINIFNIVNNKNKPEEKSNVEQVQFLEVKIPQSLNDYLPVNVRELADSYQNEPVRLNVVPDISSINNASNPHEYTGEPAIERYILIADQEGAQINAVIDHDKSGVQCSFDPERIKELDVIVDSIIDANQKAPLTEKRSIILYGQNRHDSNISDVSDLLIHKVKIGSTVYDVMRCQE